MLILLYHAIKGICIEKWIWLAEGTTDVAEKTTGLHIEKASDGR